MRGTAEVHHARCEVKLPQCSEVLSPQTMLCKMHSDSFALQRRGSSFFKKLIEKEFGSHRRSAGLSYFRSTLAYFLCVQPDITDASQL